MVKRFPFMVCFFLSGAAGLIYEVLWTRSLALSFGHTVWAMTTVLVVFMGGLALGSFLFGGVADRIRSPVRLYALLELGIGVYCLGAPRLLDLSRQGHLALVPFLGEGLLPRTATQFFLSCLVLLLPTTLMGGTVPAMAKVFITGPGTAGKRFGDLYGANTLGAALGVFVAGYWLLPAIGLKATNLLAAAVNISIGGFLLLAGMRLKEGTVPQGPPETGNSGASPRMDDGSRSGGVPERIVLWAFFLTGGTAMVFQIAWVRSLVMVIGSSTYAYSAVLLSVLLGIALGSCLFARIRLSGPEMVSGLLAGIAVSVFLLFPCFDRLPALFLFLYKGFTGNYAYIQFIQLFIVLLVVLVPTTLMGMTLPCLMGMVVRGDTAVGSDVGRYYAFNTAGAITGSVLAGFLLIPGIGSQRTLVAGIALEMLLAVAFIVFARPVLRRIAFFSAALLVSGAFLFPAWDKAGMNLGVSVRPWNFREVEKFLSLRKDLSKGLLYAREGISSTVAVFEGVDGKRWFTVNGKPDGGHGDMMTQVGVGVIPMLFHPSARRVGVLGLGTGATAGAVGLFGGVDSIDIVELEPAMLEAAAFFDRDTWGILKDPRTRVVINDGRSFFESRKGMYDVIISEPSNPWISGISNLYTVDFIRKARESLARGGVFAMWVQAYAIPRESYGMVLRTFLEVFPDATLWKAGPPGDTLIVGMKDGTGLPDLASIRSRLGGNPKLSAALGHGKALPLDPLLMKYRLGADGMRRFAGPGPLNTDDLNRLEFVAPKALYLNDLTRIVWEIAAQEDTSPPAFMKAAGVESDAFRRMAGEKHYLDGDFAMAFRELEKLPSLAPRSVGGAGTSTIPDGGLLERFEGATGMAFLPATAGVRPEPVDYEAGVLYRTDLAWITRTSGVVRGAGRNGSAGLRLRGGKDVAVGYLAPIEVEPRTRYEVRYWIRGATGADNTAVGIDVMEYDRREGDGAQPTAEYNRAHLLFGDTPFYLVGVRQAGEYSFRFTTTERSALVRLFFFVEGGIGSSVAFDDISIRKIPSSARREGGTEG
jgi:spermidine synthase